ncbi:Facilitated trehalose transporter Tret1 [Frankliniella fusca]|uniref:Facilitated trehalose transporter Tret1 n=1 Tax=Frankliniella fusca TaxID=407009 RepID=A0AAE1GVV1_9NEOP|nr:Facilitated trehalose transporter Tret1 [Frankliniella fusca]
MTGPAAAAASPPMEKQEHLAEAETTADGRDPGAVGALREALPQVLASCAKNMLLLDIGMTLAFPTVVIAALLGSKEHPREPDEFGLTFDEWQASWFGSLMLICQPFGSVLSGLLLEPLGRKRAMLLVNVPHLLSWLLLSTARTHSALFAAAALMGLGMGFMEAPIITYVGEISTPKLRGALTSMAGISVMLGFFIEYLLGTLVSWRTAAWGSVSVPLLTVLAISQVPESPMWLVSKGRLRDAERALRWLRGWVPASAVQTELASLVQYNAEMTAMSRSKSLRAPEESATVTVTRQNGVCNGGFVADDVKEAAAPPSPAPAPAVPGHQEDTVPRGRYLDGLRALRKRDTLWPLMLVISFFVIHHWTGLSGLRPFMVPVFRQFGLPVDAHWLTVLSALLGMGGNVLCMVTVAWCGKRPLALTSIGGVAVACLSLGSYHLFMSNATSAEVGAELESHWLPLVLFIVLFSFHSFGIGPIPWMLLSEVFPYQGRGPATGIAAAASYILGFFAAKTFLDIQHLVNLSGVFIVNGMVAVVGFLFMWFYLPETEGRTLQDIEALYVKKKKGISTNVQTNPTMEKTSL